jgi:GTPase SAR1 family protein
VVLLGPPGVGKSLLTSALCRHSPNTTSSLNVGEELRKEGMVQPYLEHPTEAGRLSLARRAQELVAAACRSLVAERECGRTK